MPDKKSKNTSKPSDITDATVEQRVDAMMSVEPTTAPEVVGITFKDLDAVSKKPSPSIPITSEQSPPAGNTLSALNNPDDDPTYDPLIDDIIAKEGDELLARDDAAKAAAEDQAGAFKHGARARSGTFLHAWWHNKIARYTTILVVVATIIAAAAYPATRYYALNMAGVRSGASLTIVDSSTQLPLKNVSVEIGTYHSKSNQDGLVKLSQVELGTQSLSITQAGFATINQTITLGLGSNPLGDYKLQAVGTQFRITAIDYVSGKPVKTAEIDSDQSNAQADSKGQIILTLDHDESNIRTATVSADGYRDENIQLAPGQGQNRTVVLVPAQKQIYVTKQSGTYDLYASDIDGKNKSLVLAGTGKEDPDISAVQSPDNHEAAIVSRRDSMTNQDGYVLQSLTLVNVDKKTTLTLDHSERITVIDWIDDRIIYLKIKAGTSAGSPDRYQLISYDYDTNARLQLASANSIASVASAGGSLYFATSNNYQGGVSQFLRINPDNSNKQVLLDKTDVWSTVRTSYSNFLLNSNQNNYSYNLGDNSTQVTSNTADPSTNHTYYDSTDGKNAVWVDSRDGKGVLLLTNTTTNKDTVLVADSGLEVPAHWLNDRTLVYRVVRPGETADYAISLDGGGPKKIADVTATSGFGSGNY